MPDDYSLTCPLHLLLFTKAQLRQIMLSLFIIETLINSVIYNSQLQTYLLNKVR